MNASRRALAVLLTLTLAAAGNAFAARDEGLLVDIRDAGSADIETMKSLAGVDWWLELGDQLLLVGDRNGIRSRSIVSLDGIEIDDVGVDRLALHARGCASEDEETTIGKPIATAGRWELRQLGATQALPDSSAWQPVVPGSVLARRWRSDDAETRTPDPDIAAIVQAVDPPRWFADVATLAGWDRHSRNTAQLTLARNWIGDQFGAVGLTVTMPSFTAGSPSFTASNVIGTWTGTTAPDEWIIVGGHYDSRQVGSTTTSTPGAEDNASGCSGVIEMARVIVPTQPQRSILFMCYAGEEQQMLGSKAHVAALQSSGDLAKVKHAMIMDMIGYSATDDIEVLLETNVAQQAILATYTGAAATYVPELGVVTSTTPWGSDHEPYLDAGRSSLLTIENDWDIYPHYHKPTDTPANIGPHALAMGGAILRMNAAVLALLSRADTIHRDGFDGSGR